MELGPYVPLGFPEDALAPLATLLESLDEGDIFYGLIEETNAYVNGSLEIEEEIAERLQDELIEALDELAAPYCYFGPDPEHQSYGYYIRWDDLEEAIEEGDVLSVTEETRNTIPPDYTGYLMITGSLIEGNTGLLFRERETDQWEELWRAWRV